MKVSINFSLCMASRSESQVLFRDGVQAEYAAARPCMFKAASKWAQKSGAIVIPFIGESVPGCGEFK